MPVNKSTSSLFLLFLIFFGPLLIAYVLFFVHPHFSAQKTTNHGLLLSPILNAFTLSSEFPPEKKWHLVLIADNICESDTCRSNLIALQQAHLLLGKDFERVQDLVILLPQTTDAALKPTQLKKVSNPPDFLFPGLAQVFLRKKRLFITRAAFKAWSNKAPQLSPAHLTGGILIFDPLARAVLFFPGKVNARLLYQDLVHLLKWSPLA